MLLARSPAPYSPFRRRAHSPAAFSAIGPERLPNTYTQDAWFLQPEHRPARLPRRNIFSRCVCRCSRMRTRLPLHVGSWVASEAAHCVRLGPCVAARFCVLLAGACSRVLCLCAVLHGVRARNAIQEPQNARVETHHLHHLCCLHPVQAAGGPGSDYAIVSLVRERGTVTVCFMM